MIDLETSFTVEVLGFPEGADPEAIAESISTFFGISVEEGRRLVRKSPIRVKRGASAEVTQQLVRQLRKLGADVLVRNEQTGEERSYLVKGTRRVTRDSMFKPLPPEDTLESEKDAAPAEEAPSAEAISPPAGAPEEAAPEGEAATAEEAAPHPQGDSEERERDGAEPAPDSPRAAADSDPRSDAGVRHSQPESGQRPAAALSLPPPSGPGSLPPPAAPILSLPPPAAAKLDFCGSCKGPIDRGETCSRCGWNNLEKLRHCRQCKRKLSLASAVSRKPAMVLVALLGAVTFGAAVLALLGPAAGAAGLALGGCLVFVADAFTLRFRCRSCTVAVVTERLLKEEEARLKKGRTKSLAVAGLCGLATVALLALAGLSRRALADSSYDIAWTLPLPRMHGQLKTELVSIKVPTGNKRVRVAYAQRPYIGGPVFFLTHVQYTHPAAPVEQDRAGLEASLKQIVEVYFAGSITGKAEPSGDALHASFAGTFHGKQVFGYIRGIQNDHDMVLVAVVSSDQADVLDRENRDVLNGITVQRDPR